MCESCIIRDQFDRKMIFVVGWGGPKDKNQDWRWKTKDLTDKFVPKQGGRKRKTSEVRRKKQGHKGKSRRKNGWSNLYANKGS